MSQTCKSTIAQSLDRCAALLQADDEDLALAIRDHHRRLAGGKNNSVWLIGREPRCRWVLKVMRNDRVAGAHREVRARLALSSCDQSPVVDVLDHRFTPAAAFLAIGWVEGRAGGASHWASSDYAAFESALSAVYHCPDSMTDMPVKTGLERLTARLLGLATSCACHDPAHQMMVQQTVRSLATDASELARFDHPVFGRGDPNVDNCLLDNEGRVWLLDFEYCGQSSIHVEMADLITHPSWRFERSQVEAVAGRLLVRYGSALQNVAPLRQLFRLFWHFRLQSGVSRKERCEQLCGPDIWPRS